MVGDIDKVTRVVRPRPPLVPHLESGLPPSPTPKDCGYPCAPSAQRQAPRNRQMKPPAMSSWGSCFQSGDWRWLAMAEVGMWLSSFPSAV